MRFVLLSILAAVCVRGSEWESAIAAAQRCLTEGDYTAAENKLDTALRLAALGPDSDVRTATTLNNLASIYQDQGRYREAKSAYLRSIRVWERAAGPYNPGLAQPLNNLGGLYLAMGRLKDAERYTERSLAIRNSNPGPHTPETDRAMNTLGLIRIAQNRYSEADQIFRALVGTIEARHGSTDPLLIPYLHNLALSIAGLGRTEDALQTFHRLLRIGEAAYGPRHPALAVSYFWLARTYRIGGKLTLAEPLLQHVLSVAAGKLPRNHPLLSEAMLEHAALLRAKKNTRQAKELEKQAHALRREHEAANLLQYVVDASGR